MANRKVWVETDEFGSPIRILKSVRFGSDLARVREMPKFDAVGAIRKKIWKRCDGRCEWCRKRITESGPLWIRMHMHEQAPKGKAIGGGEVSLENSVGLCQRCHEDSGHADRKLQFSKPFDLEEE